MIKVKAKPILCLLAIIFHFLIIPCRGFVNSVSHIIPHDKQQDTDSFNRASLRKPEGMGCSLNNNALLRFKRISQEEELGTSWVGKWYVWYYILCNWPPCYSLLMTQHEIWLSLLYNLYNISNRNGISCVQGARTFSNRNQLDIQIIWNLAKKSYQKKTLIIIGNVCKLKSEGARLNQLRYVSFPDVSKHNLSFKNNRCQINFFSISSVDRKIY